MQRNVFSALVLFVCIVGLIGCSSSKSTPGTYIEGQFAASTVEGLDYYTLGRSGVTDGDGTFWYQAGETVTFAIGDLTLGETTGKAIVTILDLVEGATNMDDNRTVNIARLLQSLDSDCNPRNGIQLTQQIKAELTGTQIDFDMSPDDFETDPDVVGLFDRLNALQAFTDGQTGVLRSAEEAEAHFIQAYKDTWKAQWVSADTNGDGEEDTLVEYFYDSGGRLVLTEVTPYGSDEPTRVERREYDANGYLILRQIEENGSIVYNEAYENDERGNRTKRWYDSNRDGQWNIYNEYEYDADDNLIKVSNGDGEGSFNYIIEYEYDEHGNVTRREEDRNANGVADSIWIYVYEEGNLVRQDYDDNGDDTVNRATHYTYDEHGNQLTVAYDHNNNGSFEDANDWVQTYTYGPNNLRKTQLTDSVNNGLSYVEWQYDDNGNLILERGDHDYDGETPDWSYRITRVYDGENRILYFGADWDYSGAYDEEFEFVYDEFGNVVESTIYTDGTLYRRHYIFWEQSVTSGYDTWFAPYGSEIYG